MAGTPGSLEAINGTGKIKSSTLTPQTGPTLNRALVFPGVVHNFRSIKACGHLPALSSCTLIKFTLDHTTSASRPQRPLIHCPLPISRCALHLVPPTDSLPIPIAPPPLVLHLVLRFCGHRAQCSQPLMSFVLLFIVRLSHLSLNTADQHFSLTASVFICTIICLAIAAHFQSVLSASDLSKPCMHDRYRLLNTEPSWQLVLYHLQFSYPRQPLSSSLCCRSSRFPKV